jgi:hypothetical protein
MRRKKNYLNDFLKEIGDVKEVEIKEENGVIICDLKVKRLNETILLILSKYFNFKVFSPSESKDEFFIIKEGGKDVGFISGNCIHFSILEPG